MAVRRRRPAGGISEGRARDGLWRTGSLTPQLMEVMGALVYQATAGAMELMAARQIAKREIRAEVTMIVAHGNNPLKFLPTPRQRSCRCSTKDAGFHDLGEAMQDAFDDLARA